MPLEYIALEYGVNTPCSDAIETVRGIPSLRRFKLPGVPVSDADLAALAGAKQMEELSIGVDELSDERIPQLKGLAFLKALNLSSTKKKPFSDETQTKIRALLPNTKVEFQ